MTQAVARWPGARLGILIAYFFNGLAFSSWMARLPDFQHDLGMDAATTGSVLLAAAVGTLGTVTVAGATVMRLGAARTFMIATAGFVVAYVLLGVAAAQASLPLLVVAQFLHGAAFALTNLPMSTLGAAVERAVGRTILPQFHASYSIGSVLGAAAGAVITAADVGLLAHLLVLAVLAVAVRTVAFLLVRPCSADVHARGRVPAAAGTPPRGSLRAVFGVWLEPRTLLIGIVVFAAALSEGAANNWISVAVVEAFDTPAYQGALSYSAFLAAVTMVRLFGGRLTDRLGRGRILRWSGVGAIAGLMIFAVAPSLPFAIAGFILWGAGAALAVPLGIGAAGQDPHHAPARIAAVTSLSSIANIAGPPLIGILGDVVGLRIGLASITVVLLAGVLVAGGAMSPTVPGEPAVRSDDRRLPTRR